ncbi:hypothetical protein ACFYTF_28815 [Nocardia thailandica]|uniref:DUF8176 domain-containing protein n=1 Tax=Nocardia thailandica TaxID=257275 RepID=A0ABW6PWN5_9NOCA
MSTTDDPYNPFDVELPAYVPPEDFDPEDPFARTTPDLGQSGRRRHRPDYDPAIGQDPEHWEPIREEELPPPEAPGEPGFQGDWDEWAEDLRARQAARHEAVIGNESPEHEPSLPRLKDFGGGGPVVRGRRARRTFDDGRVDERHLGGAAVLGIVGAGVVLVLTVLAVNVFMAGGDEPAPAAAGPAGAAVSPSMVSATSSARFAPAPPPAYATADCQTVRTPSLTAGAVDGDTSSPQNVVLGFEFAYYVRRDAAKARSYATADAHFGTEASLAAGIEATPAATRYCVYVTPAGGDKWTVNLHQQFPGEPVEKIAHRFTIKEVTPGSFRIVDAAHA